MTTDLSTFYKRIQRKFGDYSTYTKDLILESTYQRMQHIEDYAEWPELRETFEFTYAAGNRKIYLSAYDTSYTTDGIISLQEPETNNNIKNMSLQRYHEIIGDYTSNTAQTPTNFIRVADDEFYLYPTAVTSVVMTCFIKKQFTRASLSADSKYFTVSDRRLDSLYWGVCADIGEDKDDDRVQLYEARFWQNLRRQRANLSRGINERDVRLLPGDSRED